MNDIINETDEQGILREEKTGIALADLELALLSVRNIPPSREVSIALTHIETALLWLRK